MTAPFLKWAGGKGRLLPQLTPLLPPDVRRRRYVEPFLGGGAMFFALRPGRALLADVNEALTATYAAVRDDVGGVLRHLYGLAIAHGDDAYYEVRERYNLVRYNFGQAHVGSPLGRAEHAATFIYLNRTCFNGLHRENRAGAFNVPAGRYKNPRILDAAGLVASSAALASADVTAAPFEQTVRLVEQGDFVYLDPPYATAGAGFTSYVRDRFGEDDHVRLRDAFRELDERGCLVMLSNSDVPLVRDLYQGYRVDVVDAPRSIGAAASSRGAVRELVVRNYAARAKSPRRVDGYLK